MTLALQRSLLGAAFAASALLAAGCVTAPLTPSTPALQSETPNTARAEAFQADRQAILAMAGDFRVTFDFTETVALAPGYDLKAKKLSGGHEVVRVIEDRGNFISLQHVLVAGEGPAAFPIKHWRQDWTYEPETVLVFVGGNAWEKRPVPKAEREGQWSQVVYQVDDAPRYGGLAAWRHEDGVSAWTPPAEWRPLPRRDATTRDDYHAIDAVNRHAITPWGWVHEQDNTKLALHPERRALAREIGVNTYVRDSGFPVAVADDYMVKTEPFWSRIRAKWASLEQRHASFALTIRGEPEELYLQILSLADAVAAGARSAEDAAAEAFGMIDSYTTTDIGTLADRIGPDEMRSARF